MAEPIRKSLRPQWLLTAARGRPLGRSWLRNGALQVQRWFRKFTIRGVSLIIGLAVGLGGVIGWSKLDPAPRQWLQAPDASWPQGFTPDGKSFATLSPAGFVFWDTTSWQPRSPWTLRAMPINAFAKDGQTCVGVHGAGFESARIAWVDVASGAVRATFSAGLPRVLHLTLVNNDRGLRAFLTDRSALVCEVVTWDLATGEATRRRILGPNRANGAGLGPVCYSHDGRTLVYLQSTQGGVQLWDAETDQPLGSLLRTTSQRVAPFAGAAFTPADDRLLIGRADGAVEVWDLADRRWLRTIPVHPAGVSSNDLQVAPDGRTLASSRSRQASPSWLARNWTMFQQLLGLPTNRDDGEAVVVVDLHTGERLAHWPGSFRPKFAPDSRTIVTQESWTGAFAVRDAPPPPHH